MDMKKRTNKNLGEIFMIIKFWEKKKSIPLRGRLAVLVYIVVLIICVFLLYCAIKPPAYFPF